MVIARDPPFLPSCPRPPRFSLSSLWLLFCSSSSSPPPLTPLSSSKFRPKHLKFHPLDIPCELATVGRDFWAEFRAYRAQLQGLWTTNRGSNVYPKYGHVIQLLVVSILYKLELEFVLQTPNSNLLQYV